MADPHREDDRDITLAAATNFLTTVPLLLMTMLMIAIIHGNSIATKIILWNPVHNHQQTEE